MNVNETRKVEVIKSNAAIQTKLAHVAYRAKVKSSFVALDVKMINPNMTLQQWIMRLVYVN